MTKAAPTSSQIIGYVWFDGSYFAIDEDGKMLAEARVGDPTGELDETESPTQSQLPKPPGKTTVGYTWFDGSYFVVDEDGTLWRTDAEGLRWDTVCSTAPTKEENDD